MLSITEEFYLKNKFSKESIEIIKSADNDLKNYFQELEALREFNQLKVLYAFKEIGVSPRHFVGTNGYGYDDVGRDTLEKLFAEVFKAEAALVRPHLASATHALGVALFGLLRPNDLLISVSGHPYDTLEPIIGINGSNNGSLKEFGIKYDEIPLKDDKFDSEAIVSFLSNNKVKLAMIQRSRGYSWRNGLEISQIEEIIGKIKAVSPDTIVLVDNCYGEFVEEREPLEVGADIIVGSLIKNPGGGLAPTGAYIAGRADLVELISYRFTAPGIGAEVGSNADGYLPYYQGLFMAPHVVCEALKGAALCAKVFSDMGYEVLPAPTQKRTDIIQAVKFGSPDKVIAFCEAIQASSPVDSNVTPVPWDMPGYTDPVIMAAGTFVQGASIELSADAPIREPYIAYMQGGIVYEQVKDAMLLCCNKLK